MSFLKTFWLNLIYVFEKLYYCYSANIFSTPLCWNGNITMTHRFLSTKCWTVGTDRLIKHTPISTYITLISITSSLHLWSSMRRIELVWLSSEGNLEIRMLDGDENPTHNSNVSCKEAVPADPPTSRIERKCIYTLSFEIERIFQLTEFYSILLHALSC